MHINTPNSDLVQCSAKDRGSSRNQENLEITIKRAVVIGNGVTGMDGQWDVNQMVD